MAAVIASWIYFGYVTASKREAVLIEDRYSGIDPDNIVYPASGRFIARRIFPGRIALHRVRLFPRSLQIHFKRGLEQSEILNLDNSFYIRAALYITYRLDPEKILFLFQNLGKANWSELDVFLFQNLQDFLEKRISLLYRGDSDLANLKLKIQNYFDEKGKEEFNQEFSKYGIQFTSLTAKNIYVPDAKIYRRMLASSSLIIRQKIERLRIISKTQAQKDAADISNDVYFSRLEKIGRLLKSYPHLRDYLAVDRLGSNVEVVVMPYGRWFSPSSFLQSPYPEKKVKTESLPESDFSQSSRERKFRPFPDSAAQPAEPLSSGHFSDLTPP